MRLQDRVSRAQSMAQAAAAASTGESSDVGAFSLAGRAIARIPDVLELKHLKDTAEEAQKQVTLSGLRRNGMLEWRPLHGKLVRADAQAHGFAKPHRASSTGKNSAQLPWNCSHGGRA